MRKNRRLLNDQVNLKKNNIGFLEIKKILIIEIKNLSGQKVK